MGIRHITDVDHRGSPPLAAWKLASNAMTTNRLLTRSRTSICRRELPYLASGVALILLESYVKGFGLRGVVSTVARHPMSTKVACQGVAGWMYLPCLPGAERNAAKAALSITARFAARY
jgi:hypothetical protein